MVEQNAAAARKEVAGFIFLLARRLGGGRSL